jgi:threonylcarbamoyladenosine tRNA methylthiotransferase CDKAL1
MKIYIETYGCTSSEDNANIIKGMLSKKHQLIQDPKKADIVIINTCTVVQTTENKMFSAIEKYSKKKVIVTGCLAIQKDKIKERFPNVSIINTHNITNIEKAITKKVELITKRKETKANLVKSQNKDYGIVQISEGCKSSCTYCITKLEKGYIHSYPVKEIVEGVKSSLAQEKKLVYLASQDNGAYGLDYSKKSQLAELLKEVVKIKGDFQIRVGMANPQHIKPILKDLIEVYKNKKIKKFLHIPIQAGSNKVLKDMKRGCKVKDFKKIVKEFRKAFPGISISTDIIVGYPTESERDFQKTVKLIQRVKPEIVNISRFASRPKTLAAKLKPLPTQETKRRSTILTKIFKEYYVKKIALETH